MSITYGTRTPYSDHSDTFSPPNEGTSLPQQIAPYPATPLINPTLHREFFNAIQSRQEVSTWNQPKYYTKNAAAVTTDFLTPISGKDLNEILLDDNSHTIIIDIRSFGLYFQNRIKNSINLAVPSVLLKRSSYTLDKVCSSVTLHMGERLRNWSAATHILFYDHSATNLIHSGNSATAVLVGSKLRHAGYKGHLYYLKGGFHAFHSEFPEQCDSTKINKADKLKQRKQSMSLTLSTPLFPQSSKSAFNPFFSNIRQNLELSHGPLKERFSIRLPVNYSSTTKSQLSTWLHDVIEAEKGPKKLAEMYEEIERAEQQRLSLAMDFHSSNPDYDPSSMTFPFCITTNIEKGTMNRYNNIWPYEYSRVKVGLKDPKRDNDYINANYVAYENFDHDVLSLTLSDEQNDLIKKNLISKESLYTMHRIMKRNPEHLPHRWYVSMQAPLPETFNDFWRTVWNENSSMIVMLTREEEMNKIKCHRYWPTTLKETMEHGSIHVTLISEYKHPILNINGKRKLPNNDPDDDYITVRKFNLTRFKEQRELIHFQYTGWTDFGVPDHPLGILQLVQLVNQERKRDQEASPIIVHCSAGCGRTGTFCVIDTVIQRLSQNSRLFSDKVQETVYRFREQRISMVQTHRQFVFCYEAIVWWLLLGQSYFSVPIDSQPPLRK